MGGAKTDMEKLYCQVVSKGQGAGLPSPTDFKRNDPQVQALLLRRPAGRLGLEVPEGDQPQYGQLADCRLQGERIACPQQRYNLAANQPNSKLESGALGERMERTYSLLKQDKKTLAVKARYHNRLPDDLSLCTVINPDIVVCDNVGTNWVYVSANR